MSPNTKKGIFIGFVALLIIIGAWYYYTKIYKPKKAAQMLAAANAAQAAKTAADAKAAAIINAYKASQAQTIKNEIFGTPPSAPPPVSAVGQQSTAPNNDLATDGSLGNGTGPGMESLIRTELPQE